MTATITDEELATEYILWEAEDPFSRPCERDAFDCPNVAIYRVQWGPDDETPLDTQDQCCNQARLCLACYQFFASRSTSGKIICSVCAARTGGDYFFKRIKWAEPLRG